MKNINSFNRSLLLFVLISLGLCIWGLAIEPGLLKQKNISVSHWQNPPLRIAFFSDLHAGAPHINESYVKDLFQRINSLAPDIILIGGDLVINGIIGGTAMPIEKLGLLLGELKAPLGVYCVLGNHDWWNNHRKIRQFLSANGIKILENKAEKIKMTPASDFWLIGIGDDYTGHADIEKAFSEVNSESPRILFMHDPAALFQVKEKFFLTLAGHMHGGQVFIPGFGAIITLGEAPKKWASGWVDFPLGSLYVSKGVGTSILPVRLNAPPEFVILDLKK